MAPTTHPNIMPAFRSRFILLLLLAISSNVISQAPSNSSSSTQVLQPAPDKASTPVSSAPVAAASPVKESSESSALPAAVSSLPASSPSSAPTLPIASSNPLSSLPIQSASAPLATPSPAAKQSNASSGSSQPVSSVVVITVTRTGADGVVYTSLASTATAIPASSGTPNSSGSSSSSSNSTTLAIIGGIVGGLALLAGVVFIVFRCTQRRFSDLDDEDVAIKWPELVSRADDPSTLNPHAARPATGHGIGDDDDDPDEKPRMMYSHDLSMEPSHSDQGYPGQYDSYSAYGAHPAYPTHAEPGGYWPSAAPHPQPYASPLISPAAGYTPHDTYGGAELRSEPSVSATVVSGGRESAMGRRESGMGLQQLGRRREEGEDELGDEEDTMMHQNSGQGNYRFQGQPQHLQPRQPYQMDDQAAGGGQRQQYTRHDHQQPVGVDWDGNEVIPLTVVGGTNQRNGA